MSSCVESLYNSIAIIPYFQSHRHLLRDYVTQQINLLQWILLIAITYILLEKVGKLFKLWSKGRLIPGPPCPSFYGHADVISRSNLTGLLSKSHEMYGSIIKIWLGPIDLLVSIKDPEIIKEMLVKAEDKLPLTGKALNLAFGKSSLFVSSFEKVEKRRNSLEIALHGKLLERSNMIPTKVANLFIKKIQNVKPKGGLNCEIVSQNLAFSFLGATLFGDKFLVWSKSTLYEELLMKISKDACFWASYNITPFWKLGFWRYRRLCTKLKFLTEDIIKKCRHSNNFSSEFDGIFDRSEESYGNIVSLMFHGSLTTAGLIASILTRLVKHPEIQDKIHSEIMTVHKDSKEQSQKDVHKMSLLLATVYESARLLPAGPLLQRCSLRDDLDLQSGVQVPGGAILVVPVQLVQTDISNWGNDASHFNPYRFLSKADSSKNVSNAKYPTYILNDPNQNSAFLPFGYGARSCIGQKLAILGIASLFASLLENYEIKNQPGSENNPKPKMNDRIYQLVPSPSIIFEKRNI